LRQFLDRPDDPAHGHSQAKPMAAKKHQRIG